MSKYGVFSGLNTGKYGSEKNPYSDTSHSERQEKLETSFVNLVSFGSACFLATENYGI